MSESDLRERRNVKALLSIIILRVWSTNFSLKRKKKIPNNWLQQFCLLSYLCILSSIISFLCSVNFFKVFFYAKLNIQINWHVWHERQIYFWQSLIVVSDGVQGGAWWLKEEAEGGVKAFPSSEECPKEAYKCLEKCRRLAFWPIVFWLFVNCAS